MEMPDYGGDMKKWIQGFFGFLFTVVAFAPTAQAGRDCLPFFDSNNTQVATNVAQPNGTLAPGRADITPAPISVSAFDEMVLQACGEFGSQLDQAVVRPLIDRMNPELIKQLLREFPKVPEGEMRDMIFRSWTRANGFEHVFCGQPRMDKIGGLHLAARYQELQKKGQLCRLENNVPNEEVLPGNVYTVGAGVPGGVNDLKKGFSIQQSAEDIVFQGARTFLRNCAAPAKDRRVCISRSLRNPSFGSLFVCAPGKGIITFYPLASVSRGTPDCI